jgi:hypothetical protein
VVADRPLELFDSFFSLTLMRATWAPMASGYRIEPIFSGPRRAAPSAIWLLAWKRGARRKRRGTSWLLQAANRLLVCLAPIVVLALPVAADAPFENDELAEMRAEEIRPLDQRLEDASPETTTQENSFLDPEAAKFDTWQPLADEELCLPWDLPEFNLSCCFHDLGFRHSSTHGRNVGRGRPLTHSSWRNRPYHVDWFLGGMLNSSLIRNRVQQNNSTFAGLRIGWDFDHYWGTGWRFGWSDPNIDYRVHGNSENASSRLFLSDLDLLYYPWGDSKIRPYVLLGLGFTRVNFLDENHIHHGTSLLTMPYGAGLQFPQWPWLIWRFEILDNLAFGADQVETLANVSFTLGMELRLGARPASYWPWRSSRYIW